METNVVADLGNAIADGLGNALSDGLGAAYNALDANESLHVAQNTLGTILLMFVGIAALFYVGRWLYKAFKRGAS